MAKTITGDYWLFYDIGRDDKIIKNDIDVERLAEQLHARGGDLRQLLYDACGNAAKPLESGKYRRAWIGEYRDEISKAGGDEELAYTAYLRGRIDELAYDLERELREELPMPEWAEAPDEDDANDDEEGDEGDDDSEDGDDD